MIVILLGVGGFQSKILIITHLTEPNIYDYEKGWMIGRNDG